jgi:hypothetical protein
MEDGSSIVTISSFVEECEPYTYKGRLLNGKLCTANGEYSLYERDGKRLLVYHSYGGNTVGRFEYISNINNMPIQKVMPKDCNICLTLQLY